MDFNLLIGAAIAGPAALAAVAGHAARRRGSRAAHLAADVERLWSLTGEGLCEMSLDGTIVRCSVSLAHDLGTNPANLVGRHLADLAHPEDATQVLTSLNPLATGAARNFVVRMRSGDGAWRSLSWHAEIDTAARTIHAVARRPDAPHERHAAATAFDLAFAGSPIGMAIVRPDGIVDRVNAPMAELSGGDPHGRHLDELIIPEDLAAHREQLARLVAGELSAVSMDLRVRRGDDEIPVRFAVSLVRDDSGAPHQFVVQMQDASERKRLQDRVRFEAEHDPLTGLLNRRAFTRLLSHHVAHARRYKRQGALVVFDIDGLRDINEAFGTPVGDAVLDATARFLAERLRETGVICRLGGDEFGVMLAEIDGSAARAMVADLVKGAADRALRLAGTRTPVHVTVSAGITLFGDEVRSSDQLFTEADLALLEAKAHGSGEAVVYDGGVRERRMERNSRRSWAEKLRTAVGSDGFLLDAQPIVDLASGATVQYELLLRMRDDDGSIVRPNAFLGVAERYGLMREIDEWVIRRGIALARARMEAGNPVTLALNVSGESVVDRDFLPMIVDELSDAPDVGEHLVFEISERTVMADLTPARRMIARLGDFGCRFSLDDFGAGAGSFNYLKNLPVDFVKLDGEFTRGLPDSETDREIVRAVVAAARALGLQVIAECVEDEEILGAIREFGIDIAQGLCVGRPARASMLLELEEPTTA